MPVGTWGAAGDPRPISPGCVALERPGCVSGLRSHSPGWPSRLIVAPGGAHENEVRLRMPFLVNSV